MRIDPLTPAIGAEISDITLSGDTNPADIEQIYDAVIENPGFQVRFRWRNGSVAIWDNRSTQHFAVADYLPGYRRMHRVIVNTDRRVDSQS